MEASKSFISLPIKTFSELERAASFVSSLHDEGKRFDATADGDYLVITLK